MDSHLLGECKNEVSSSSRFEGRLLKYSMQMKNEDNKGFKMEWELKKIEEIPFNSNDFEVTKKYKKVEKLD